MRVREMRESDERKRGIKWDEGKRDRQREKPRLMA
jgi:hypothetical protein